MAIFRENFLPLGMSVSENEIEPLHMMRSQAPRRAAGGLDIPAGMISGMIGDAARS
jgi:hypothetical protein